MTTLAYPALFLRHPGETAWSVLFPDFPAATSVAEREADLHGRAADALATAVEDLAERGEVPPAPSPWDAVDAFAREAGASAERCVFASVPVELPSAPVRVNVSLEQNLLRRIDREAESRGMSRSGFLAEGARRLLREGAEQVTHT